MPSPPPVRVPLVQGAYTAQNFISAAQRSLNLYPEKGPAGEDSPTTIYQTPGLTRLGLPPQADPVRGLYRATNGELFAAIGNGIYFIDDDWTSTLIGTTATGTTPVKMGDNGTDMVIVDGSAFGWSVVLATHVYAAISDPNFFGSNFVETMDTYLIFDKPDDTIFYCSDSNAITFDPLFFAAKTGYPDKISAIAVQNRNIWLIGNQATSEIWFDAGAADFPFQIMPGPFVEHGTIAKYSIAKYSGSVFWLSQDPAGTSIVVDGSNFTANRISTPAIEAAIGSYATISDAIGWCYEQLGHAFYWLKVPSANGGLGADWVYDISTKLWGERSWLNPATCEPEGHRANASAFAYGINVVGDRETGQLYMLDPNNPTDAGDFIERRRGYPHMMANGSRASYPSFIADMAPEEGGVLPSVAGLPTGIASDVTYPMTVTVINTTFDAPDDTLLQDYFFPWAISAGDDGSQYTIIDDTNEAQIEGGVLTGVSSGATAYLASGKPTSADYIARFQAIPADYDAVAFNGAQTYLIGRANASYQGYLVGVTSDGVDYRLDLVVMGAATTSVLMGTIASGYYEVFLSMQGQAIDAAVQRSEDGLWLADDTTWGADFVKAISITDATYTTAGNVLIGGVW